MTPSPRLRGILFDKDGTLLDFDATWAPATAAVLATLAEGDEQRLAAMSKLAGFDHVAVRFHPDSPFIAGDTASFAPGWARLLDVAYDAVFEDRVNALFRQESLKSLSAYDDVAGALDALHALGLKIGLATNDAESSAHAHLNAMGITERFDFVAGYDSGHGAKPEPGMVKAFAEAIGAFPEEVALVGDTAHDMAAARAVGALAIGIARSKAAAAALEPLADIIIEGLDALTEHVSGRSDKMREV